MAHSFIFSKNKTTERTIGVLDSLLHVFMYFFNDSIKSTQMDEAERSIYEHYQLELSRPSTSSVDLMLQEVYDDPVLKSWYVSVLSRVNMTIELFGGNIDHDYLNSLNIGITYGSPVSVAMVKTLINDIEWLLNIEGKSPSGEFKWFEES